MYGQDPRLEGMSFLEKRSYRQMQLIGMPAGSEAWRSAYRKTGSIGSAAVASVPAALGEMASPFTRGVLEMAGGDVIYGKSNFAAHWMGFGFEKTGSLSGIAQGQSPFAFKGHMLTDKGAEWAGTKTGATTARIFGKTAGKYISRGVPLAMYALGPYFAIKSGIEGFHKGGLVGAAGGVAKESLFFAGFHLASRVMGPGLIPVMAHAAGYAHMAGKFKADIAASPRHIPVDITGNMAAFQTGKAQTMRQRSLQAIQRHHMNARSALGNEANYMHVSSLRMM